MDSSNQHLQSVRDDFGKTQAWLCGVGISTKGTRFQEIEGILERLRNMWDPQGGDPLSATEREQAITALADTRSFGMIRRGLATLPSHRLPKRAIRQSLAGPLLARDEVAADSSNHARNRFFELEVAALLRARGVEPVAFDDLTVVHEGRRLIVECKRVFSERSLRKNAEAAARQLRKRLGQHDRGLIALSLEKVRTEPFEVMQVPTLDEASERANSFAHTFCLSHDHCWTRIDDAPILGVWALWRALAYVGPTRSLERIYGHAVRVLHPRPVEDRDWLKRFFKRIAVGRSDGG